MSNQIVINFDDGQLHGYGQITTEDGKLYADGPRLVEHTNIIYIDLDHGHLVFADRKMVVVAPGSYAVCKGGLFKRLDL